VAPEKEANLAEVNAQRVVALLSVDEPDVRALNQEISHEGGEFVEIDGLCLSGKKLDGADLSWCRFTNCDFRDASLENAILDHACVEQSDLSGADFTCASLLYTYFMNCSASSCTFEELDLVCTRFIGCDLERASFSRSRFKTAGTFERVTYQGGCLREAKFKNAILDQVQFIGDPGVGGAGSVKPLEMSGSEFSGATVTGGSFAGVRLDASSFHSAAISQTVFNGSSLRDATFDCAETTDCWFMHAECQHASFASSRLTGASFASAKLQNSDFGDADLHGAYLGNSDLAEANLVAADLTGAILVGADLSRAILFDGARSEPRGEAACLRDADLRRAKLWLLDGNDIRGARFSPGASDPWSILRRVYTGPRMLWNVLLLLVFLAPLGARAAIWSSAAMLQEQLEQVTPQSAPSIWAREIWLWQALIGWDRGVLYSGAVALLVLYNAGRGLFTFRLSTLRDLEERSGHAPDLSSYRVAWYLHIWVMKWCVWLAWSWGALQLCLWLATSVRVPG
jgi:uncharacterized protein YjbI with pentapeptide repeats